MKANHFISRKLVFTLISIFTGFFVGAVVLLIIGINPFTAYSIMIKGCFGKTKYLAYVIINSTPIIMTGLSVAFAFRTGLFNIGVEGQLVTGAMAAAAVGVFISSPPPVHVLLAISAAIAAGAAWGGIAGALKAKFGINEVISSIMLNWIALYLNNYFVFFESFKRVDKEASRKILQSASIRILEGWKTSGFAREWLGTHPALEGILSTPFNWGIFIALAAAILVAFILNKTTLGYALRSVGFNHLAAEYCGINVHRSVLISMMISGGIAGAAGAVHVLGHTGEVLVLSTSYGYGFDGIAVALIGANTAAGSVFAGFLLGALKYGGQKIQPLTGAPSEVIQIIIGTIIFFTAIPLAGKLKLKGRNSNE